MKLTLLGVGEAFDPAEPNSAALLEADGFTLMIDCGFSVPPRLWATRPHPEAVDAIYLTHHHADHVTGLPALLDSWRYAGRRKGLTIHTTAEGIAQLRAFFALFGVAPEYELRLADVAGLRAIGPFAVRFAPMQHPAPVGAIRLEHGGRRLAWSGDGRPTAEARALFRDAHLLLQECYEPEAAPKMPWHCDLPTAESVDGPARIGLYHIRAGQRPAMRAAVGDSPRFFVPEAGDVLEP